MEEPPSIHCLVCSAQCSLPAQRVAELQARVVSRLQVELSRRPPPQQHEALCSPCVHLLGDLDELLAQVDRLRLQLRDRRAAGQWETPADGGKAEGQSGGKAGPEAGCVTVKKDMEAAGAEGGGPVAAAVCQTELAEPPEEVSDPLGLGELVPGPTDGARHGAAPDGAVLAILPDACVTAGETAAEDPLAERPTDSEEEEEEGKVEFVGPGSPPDQRTLLGLPSSPHLDSPDDPLTDGDAPAEADKEFIGPHVPPGTMLIGTRITAKPVRRKRPLKTRPEKTRPEKTRPEKTRPDKTRPEKKRSEAPPVPWLRVEGPAPYQCIVCNRQFQYLASIKIHARTHTGEKPHECDVCGRRFAQRTTLINHRRLHSGDKPFKCGDCGRAFAQQSYLCVHRRVHSKEKPFCCELCGKTFKQSYYLNIHKRIHSGEKPYTCDDCGKGFVTVSNLYKHQRAHRGERRFCCEHCGKTFSDGCHLRDHRRTHTGERPFACNVCGMTFALAKILARHMRMHTGEKPYPCLECGKAFSRKESLRDHAKVHENMSVPSPASAAAAAALADGPGSPDPAAAAAGDDRFYMVDVMPVAGVEEALAWPLEVYRTETGVTVYKTVGEDGAALYQTETGEVFREMSGNGEQPPPPPPPPPLPSAEAVGDEHDEPMFDDPAAVPGALPAYDRLGI